MNTLLTGHFLFKLLNIVTSIIEYKFPNWIKLAILIVIGVVIVAAIRGCNNSNTTLAENNKLKADNKRLSQRTHQDSIDRKESQEKYEFSESIQNGIISIQENKLQAANDTLDKANIRINKLIAKYKPVTANSDTNVTLVPNEYISDCSQCFTELEGQQQKINNFKIQSNTVQQALNTKINIQQARISELGREQIETKNTLDSSRAINEAYQKNLSLRGRLFFSMGVMSINSIMPNAAGLGLMYQDKRYRIVGFRYYTSQYGGVKALDIHMPLSLRR